jgi:hypothetical protein
MEQEVKWYVPIGKSVSFEHNHAAGDTIDLGYVIAMYLDMPHMQVADVGKVIVIPQLSVQVYYK